MVVPVVPAPGRMFLAADECGKRVDPVKTGCSCGTDPIVRSAAGERKNRVRFRK